MMFSSTAVAAMMAFAAMAAANPGLPTENGDTKSRLRGGQKSHDTKMHERDLRIYDKDLDEEDTVNVLVKVQNSVGASVCARDATKIIHSFNTFGIMALEVPRSRLDNLRNSSGIEYVSMDKRVQFIHPVNEIVERRQNRRLAQSTPWGITRVLQETDLQPGPRANEIKVCVIDTGYDLGHPDLPDATGTNTDSGIWDVDGNGHGTHCAGTIAAMNNEEGVVGVIGDGNGITVHIGKGLEDSGSGTFEAVMEAFEGCVDAGADIVSMSLGCSGEDDCYVEAFEDMVTKAYNDFGVLTISAAGNDGNTDLSYPASFEASMSVAAMEESERLASFSQRNHQVEITGPGVFVESTWKNNGYNTISGTSMATPHVAGTAALLWSYNPDCTPKQIRKILLASARPLGEKVCTTDYGYGLVQAKDAVDMLTEGGCDAGENARPDMLDSDGLYVGCRLKTGEECSSHGECLTNICITGVCRDEKLGEEEVCEDHGECINNSCALGSYEEGADKKCCKGGGYMEFDVPWTWRDETFCTGLQAGDLCGSNSMCDSNICVAGKCAAERLADLAICEDDDADCASGSCSRKSYEEDAEMTCCKSGGRVKLDVPWTYSDLWFCTGLLAGESCGSDQMCSSGLCIFGNCTDVRLADGATCESNNDCANRACALGSYEEDAELKCCKGGSRIELDVPWTYRDESFCTRLQVGELCGSNSMCDSNICIAGKCAAERLADLTICEDDDADCASGSCSRKSYEEDAEMTCCKAGGRVKLDVPWTYSDLWFCTGLLTGESCGSDQMCSSGLCIFGVCADDRLDDGATCENNNDCINRTCALGSFEEDAELKCCKGGFYVESDVPWTYRDESFCMGLPAGTSCGSDTMCELGVCNESGQCT